MQGSGVIDEPDDELLEALAATPTSVVLPRGTVVDAQYRIERVLGEAGMGVAYLARDLRLEREVAIKIGNERSSVAIGRMAREALVLARISSPRCVRNRAARTMTARGSGSQRAHR
jgi:serine/threonine protein kinase